MNLHSAPYSLREATVADIPELHRVRLSVQENQLSDPGLVTPADYEALLTVRGKGWVGELAGTVAGFAIADLQSRNIWALFVHPQHQHKGLGKALFTEMLRWCFAHGCPRLWLTTAANTRAEQFYRKAGWRPACSGQEPELLLELDRKSWQQKAK